jgi:transaldolase/glucose-6-phosphate isomerase
VSSAGLVERIWAHDASVWTDSGEEQWLGWLDEPWRMHEDVDLLLQYADSVVDRIDSIVLLGMGGSSLAPEVLRRTFRQETFHVLDTTHPQAIRDLEAKIDVARTLFVAASKSGSTLETRSHADYFWEQSQNGELWAAVTDPGSALEELALERGFGAIFAGVPAIGGRYSALSAFGMVPAALMGLDVARLLLRAQEMADACRLAEGNPGLELGLSLGEGWQAGRDKICIEPHAGGFGLWAEQLLAESTGKQGKGLIPVDAEPLGDAGAYGHDRVFAYLRLTPEPDPKQDQAIDALERANHPVVRIAVGDRYHIGQEFFRWEIATAVAGAILRINPFDQPDVEASKVKTRELTDAYEKSGALPPEAALFARDGIALFADTRNRAALGEAGSLAGYLQAHLRWLVPGDYCALLAYLERNKQHDDALQDIRRMIRDRKRVATCLGFGPRFLHSTGQAYKGGPNTGVFLQITCDDDNDLAVPGRRYTFGAVEAAQARGDFEVLAERGRRVLRVHLGAHVAAGLTALKEAVRQALG